MCGIVGYIGERDSVPIILDSLQRLEYRGYDSAGIAVIESDGRLRGSKAEGKLSRLAERLRTGIFVESPADPGDQLRDEVRTATVRLQVVDGRHALAFDAQRGTYGALLVGSPDEVTEKILRHSEALGGVSRFTFQMNAASLPHAKLMQAIELLGTKVAPELRKEMVVV